MISCPPYCFLWRARIHSGSIYWSGVAQCGLVVGGILPFEQKGIPQLLSSVLSGHVAWFFKNVLAPFYCIATQFYEKILFPVVKYFFKLSLIGQPIARWLSVISHQMSPLQLCFFHKGCMCERRLLLSIWCCCLNEASVKCYSNLKRTLFPHSTLWDIF